MQVDLTSYVKMVATIEQLHHAMLIVNLYYSLHDHLLLKTSKQLTVCIFYQSIHETLSSCISDRWLRGGAVVVTSGSAGIKPLKQGRRM
jgi:hypothetical protein